MGCCRIGFGGLVGRFQVCCSSLMAEEKSGSKNIVLWIITVLLVGLAIFLYKR